MTPYTIHEHIFKKAFYCEGGKGGEKETVSYCRIVLPTIPVCFDDGVWGVCPNQIYASNMILRAYKIGLDWLLLFSGFYIAFFHAVEWLICWFIIMFSMCVEF